MLTFTFVVTLELRSLERSSVFQISVPFVGIGFGTEVVFSDFSMFCRFSINDPSGITITFVHWYRCP